MAKSQTFKGHPVLNFEDSTDDRYCTKMGITKFKTILNDLEAVLDFLEENGSSEFVRDFRRLQLSKAENELAKWQ